MGCNASPDQKFPHKVFNVGCGGHAAATNVLQEIIFQAFCVKLR